MTHFLKRCTLLNIPRYRGKGNIPFWENGFPWLPTFSQKVYTSQHSALPWKGKHSLLRKWLPMASQIFSKGVHFSTFRATVERETFPFEKMASHGFPHFLKRCTLLNIPRYSGSHFLKRECFPFSKEKHTIWQTIFENLWQIKESNNNTHLNILRYIGWHFLKRECWREILLYGKSFLRISIRPNNNPNLSILP